MENSTGTAVIQENVGQDQAQNIWGDDLTQASEGAVSGTLAVLEDSEKLAELATALGYESLVQISETVCLAQKKWKYTLADKSGTPMQLSIPWDAASERWFGWRMRNGDGMILFEKQFMEGIRTRGRFFRFAISDGSYTWIRDAEWNDLSSKISHVDDWNTLNGYKCVIYTKESGLHIFEGESRWNINSEWMLVTNLTPVEYRSM